MANIQYTSSNNPCNGNSIGTINISQINLQTPSEQASFASYNISWSGTFSSPSQISADGRSLNSLDDGTYSFTINSLVDSSVLGPYIINISSPPELKITDIKYSRYICGGQNGSMLVAISGGTPPYTVVAGSISSDSSSDPYISLSGLIPTTMQVTVRDANNCTHTWDDDIIIRNSSLSTQIIESIPPTLLNSYGVLRLKINGYGPFNLSFTNDETEEVLFIDAFATEYITSSSDTQYEYRIADKLVPGTYTLNVTNNYGCSLSTIIGMPNIQPMTVTLNLIPDNLQTLYWTELTLPIFDTILIPYSHIQNNSSLWQLIKQFNLKDHINIQIDGVTKQYRIVRTMLDKYGLDENKIEILRLGNDSKDWFFYFYVAPSVNLNNDSNLINAQYKIIDPITSNIYNLTLGLDEYNSLDTTNASLIKGSFLLNGVEHSQFVNALSSNFLNKPNNAYVSIGEQDTTDYDFALKNVSKVVLQNIYSAGYITSINFLEQFNRLNMYVNINDTARNMSMEDYQYAINIKNLLVSINNFNNIANTYIFNLDNISHIGQLSIFVDGNLSFVLENQQFVSNEYDISYFTFDDESLNLQTFYRNNQPIKDTTIGNLSVGYVLIRVRDKYQNIPRTIRVGNSTINYDEHFLIAKNIIQKYNKNITNYFEYGDILVYINSKDDPSPPLNDNLLPKPVIPTPQLPTQPTVEIVTQTPDSTNTGSLSLQLLKNITCLLTGPKNYTHTFKNDIQFINMIPGVYTIKGDPQELYNSNLYQQEYRLLIEKNKSYSVDIDFVSYRDKVFIKDL